MKDSANFRRARTVLLAVAAALALQTEPARSQSAQGSTPQKTAVSSQLGVFVYPKNNQSQNQQVIDENECYAWAKQQTGIDPSAPSAPPQQAKQPKGGGAKGAAGGAATGAAIGAIAGDAGKGAAVGATAGAMGGRRAQKKASQQAQQQAQSSAKQQQQQTMQTFKNAFGACMDARKYSVK